MRKMRLRGVFQPIMAVICLVGARSFGSLPVFASQEVSPATKTGKGTIAGLAVASVDPRYRSPRATERTFLIAMNRTEDDPSKIEEAVVCLDLSPTLLLERERPEAARKDRGDANLPSAV
jgi:hypothetical protein